MAQIKRNRCYVCDKGVAYGNNVSHANNRTRRTFKPNLQRIQIEQKVDEAAKRAEELRKQQEDLQHRTEKLDPKDRKSADELAKEQKDLQEQMAKLQKELEELQKKMEEFPGWPVIDPAADRAMLGNFRKPFSCARTSVFPPRFLCWQGPLPIHFPRPAGFLLRR